MKFLKLPIILGTLLLVPNILEADGHKGEGMKDYATSNVKTAKKWTKAFYTDKTRAQRMVSKYMADDGYNYPGRFIGFGFTYNPDSDERVVDTVIPDSTASKILQPGDKFTSVNGVPATKENWDNGKLSFGGKPGETVNLVILRDGKEIPASFQRGLVDPKYSKSDVLDNISQADADNWGAMEYKIIEVAENTDNNVVYVWSWHKSMNNLFDVEFEENVVTRFRFNDAGKIVALGNLSEQELVQSQLGFTVSRN
jgi:hypothetical protein